MKATTFDGEAFIALMDAAVRCCATATINMCNDATGGRAAEQVMRLFARRHGLSVAEKQMPTTSGSNDYISLDLVGYSLHLDDVTIIHARSATDIAPPLWTEEQIVAVECMCAAIASLGRTEFVARAA